VPAAQPADREYWGEIPGEELMTCSTSAVPIFLCGASTLGKLTL
jgi:hypothetical protein